MRGKNRAYLFSRLENGLSRAAMVSATDDVVFKKVMCGDYSVEHIMPQTLTQEWRDALGVDADHIRDVWRHRLGNLTLTAYNSEMSNKTFSEKACRTLQELKADGFGFDDEAHHISYLNDYVKKQECWTQAQIEERANLFADKALQLWALPQTAYQPSVPDEHVYSIRDNHISFFTNSKPLAVRVRGTEYKCDSWTALAKRIMVVLAAESPEKLRYAADRSLTIRFANHKSPQLIMDELVPGVFACFHGSVQEKCMVMQQAFAGFPDFDAEVVVSDEIDADE